ncbi:lipoprotein N-acyltransferase Lnb domain-containing protein [Mariniblastus fucicola]|uniref:Lnb N-terminal periplasmic domain-containing protein n=1 Tax=Mariniblastus fucicola TaxID=980251 RepID=A0A5B9PC18_9BACT|nr:DUF4105 domain-containing protein [Mariniblastus fucicola]QEG22462.1 hypothetical protein MFFC18_23420 [Mariniblastus fucicola]
MLAFFLWAVGAVWHFDLLPQPISSPLSVALVIAACALFARLNPKRTWLTFAGATVFAVWLISLLQQPTHNRDWIAGQAELSQVAYEGDQVTIKKFRHNVYRSASDYDVHRSELNFRLSQLSRVWFIVQRFSASEGLAHVFLSFEIAPYDGGAARYFSVSVEIRREQDESFSPIQGLYRRYELNYVFGAEQDLIGVRTVMRPDDRVFMYPVNATPQQVQRLFARIADRTNQIYDRPEFYHTMLNNCMNGILRHTAKLTPVEISWFDPKIILPGYSDRFAYEKGIIGSREQSFDLLQQACRIDVRAREFGIADGFSEAIRKPAN